MEGDDVLLFQPNLLGISGGMGEEVELYFCLKDVQRDTGVRSVLG